MLGLRKFCFRCFKSEESPPDLTLNTSTITQTKSPFQQLDKSQSALQFSDPIPFKRLLLTITEAKAMPTGEVLEIEVEGLKGSQRSRRDGRTYAGYDQTYCDIILPKDDLGVGSIHFVIEYNSVTAQYLLKDQGNGTGTFAKLISPLPLQSYYILSFGSTHMTVILTPGDKAQLTLKFIEGPKSGQSYVYTNKNEVIKIGRMPDCSIKFEDTSLSRYQCSLRYVSACGWIILDGDGFKPSTNGTWLFLDDYFPITTGTTFKAGMTLFRAAVEGEEDTAQYHLSP